MRNRRTLRVRTGSKLKVDDRNRDEKGKRHHRTILCARIDYLRSPSRGFLMTRLLPGRGDRIQPATFPRRVSKTSMRSTDREEV